MNRALGRTLAVWLALYPLAVQATQDELVPPTSGIFTGVQFSQKIGDAFRALASCNKGAVAPANVGGAAVDGMCWIDDSGSPWIKKRFVNGAWAVEGYLDPSDSSNISVSGGGVATISAGATVDLGSVPQKNVTVSGAATITSFGASALTGIEKTIRFDGVSTITPGPSLLVPGSTPLVTAAGDRALVTHLGSGNWEITTYTRASGIPVDASAVGKFEYGEFESVPALHVAGFGQALSRVTYPAYLARVTRAQNGTRTNGNATITLANTSGFGAGMPVEGTGIADSCTIASVVANTSITLNSSSCVTASGTSTVTVFLHGYGAGGDKTTVGVDDCRNRVIAGRDRNDPGSLSNRLTSSYFGGDSSVFGATGSSSENVTMAIANLISHQHSVFMHDPGHSHGGIPVIANRATTDTQGNAAVNLSPTGSTNSAGTGITIGSVSGVANDNQTSAAGSATPTPMRTVQPTLIAECVVRVTP